MAESKIYEQGTETQWAELMSSKAMEMNEALKFLNEDFPIRSLSEMLCEAAGYYKHGKWIEVPQDEARDILLTTMGYEYEQKINSWLPANQISTESNQVERIKKDSAMQVAYALNMTLEDAEIFLRRCWLDALYLRDVKDIIYRCGLVCGFSYGTVSDLIHEFAELDMPNPDPVTDEESHHDNVTLYLSNGLDNGSITCPDDLRLFIKTNGRLFGSYRRRVHSKFMELYNQVRHDLDGEAMMADDMDRIAFVQHEELIRDEIDNPRIGVRKTISQGELLKLFSTGISDLKASVKGKGIGVGLTAIIRKHIIENIPGRAEWSGIINKTADKKTGAVRSIDRKLFILIWLSSDDGNTDMFAGKPDTTPEVALENHVMTLNDTILLEYGFPPLDPRHPFDWVIMNTLYLAHVLHKGEDSTDIPVRMENLFRQL